MTASRFSAGPLDELPTDRCVSVAAGRAIVVRVRNEVAAFQNECLHQASPLAGGLVRGGVLVCPLHFWMYDMPAGTVHGSGEQLPRYDVEVVDGEVFVDVPEEPPARSMREQLLAHAAEWRAARVPVGVVWDMGGILYRYFTEMVIAVGRDRGWPIDGIPLGPTHRVPDAEYEAMDRGEIGEPEYVDLVVARLSGIGVVFDPPRELDWHDQYRSEVWTAIERLDSAGFRQGLLTNDASRWLGEEWWEWWEPAKWFDAIVDVTTLGVRKPAPEPYLAAAEGLGLSPTDCLFVDDMHVNCEGAAAVGMQSHWFDVTQPQTSVDALLERLGLVGEP